MMLFKKTNSGFLDSFLLQLEALRTKYSVIAFAPGITGYNWMGVNRATHALFPENTIDLPQEYSNSIFTEKELDKIIEKLIELHFETVIYSGFPKYFEKIILGLKAEPITQKVIYHGFFSELAGNVPQQEGYKKLIELAANGYINSIAFNKKGMAESVQRIYGIRTHKIIIPTPELNAFNTLPASDKIRIGVLGNNAFRKNLVNQFVAASMIDNAEIHITSEELLDIFPNTSNVVLHTGGMEHQAFINLLASMDINLHVSYSESWGQITTESIALGVPCITSYHSDVFDYSEELKEQLIVEDYDNSTAISDKIQELLKNNSVEKKSLLAYSAKLNDIAKNTIDNFLA